LQAAAKPEGPAPMMSTSYSMYSLSTATSSSNFMGLVKTGRNFIRIAVVILLEGNARGAAEHLQNTLREGGGAESA
ncbi:MAG: hypothetical protein WC997_12045, partial [Porticoccaceae bacterium]